MEAKVIKEEGRSSGLLLLFTFMFFDLFHESFEGFGIGAFDIDLLVVFEFEVEADPALFGHYAVEAGELGIPFLPHGFLWHIDDFAGGDIIPFDFALHGTYRHHAELDTFLRVAGDDADSVEVVEYAGEYQDDECHHSQDGAVGGTAHHKLDEGDHAGNDQRSNDGQEVPLAEALFVFIFHECHRVSNIVKCLQRIYIEFTQNGEIRFKWLISVNHKLTMVFF